MAFRDQNRTREHGLFARVSCDHGKNHLPLNWGLRPYSALQARLLINDHGPNPTYYMPETSC